MWSTGAILERLVVILPVTEDDRAVVKLRGHGGARICLNNGEARGKQRYHIVDATYVVAAKLLIRLRSQLRNACCMASQKEVPIVKFSCSSCRRHRYRLLGRRRICNIPMAVAMASQVRCACYV